MRTIKQIETDIEAAKQYAGSNSLHIQQIALSWLQSLYAERAELIGKMRR